MFDRQILPLLIEELAHTPAVVLLGPRQVGKTTLALQLAQGRPSLYLDLESDADRAKLFEAELYLAGHQDKLVILDEVHRVPALFPVLRGLIDQARRAGRRSGLYLLLGSASLDLLAQSGETLAGRVSYMELGPLVVTEVGEAAANRLWLRGGLPDSFSAANDERSLRWRQNFIRTYLERDVPQFGPRIPAETLRRFWTMLAHLQGSLLNVAQLARNLGVDAKTAHRYIDLLCDLLLVRRLPPWHANVGKRLVKSPKIYVRDSGLVHALLGIGTQEALLGHPVLGASWEGFVLENLLACAGADTQAYFYRTSGGAEIDIVLYRPDGALWAVEVKRSLSPRLERGFHSACEDLQPARKFVVYPGTESYPMAGGAQALSLVELCALLG
ncbi:ATP-binding protein [Pseudothauera rhizosphaerae]|uniref:ATP-binding protein n=1 Tax=Pseudothauera rhizosphaerae TaxID=2565932 RepID=A0A4S4AY44_9RHOO|nr:ATP-binding protein [Pseudothauera rhizosphaerae]THF65028.1 ATP-binding protein [Pseudothauera rhizosphaerae]